MANSVPNISRWTGRSHGVLASLWGAAPAVLSSVFTRILETTLAVVCRLEALDNAEFKEAEDIPASPNGRVACEFRLVRSEISLADHIHGWIPCNDDNSRCSCAYTVS